MNRKVVLAAIVAVGVLALLGRQPVRAQETGTGSHSITVAGDAVVKVAPDEVALVLGVETWDKDIQVAKKQNDERMTRVIALAKNSGVESKYIQTDRISVEPRYRNGTYTDADFLGYFVRKTVAITLKDLTRFEELYTGALAAGANHALGIEFRTTELRKYRDEARALAVQAAQEKAVALAGKLGQRVGKAQSIRENSSGWSSSYGSRWGGSMAQNVIQNSGGTAPGDSDTFAPGQISVNASVTVTFEMD